MSREEVDTMPRNPSKDELRTFTVDVTVSYTKTVTVRARTVRGASAAARAGGEADYPGADIHTGYPQERGAKE